ncbi:MAG: calcium-binding protein, partial [Selenomonadaceae bacterium]|nr:calcium-binding protein [Selenomonadaceae bacterium]
MALNITNSTANTLITGTSENDSIINLGDNVTISIADGDNTILNGSDGAAANNVLISVGGGNNAITIQGGSDKSTVLTGNGNNLIESTSPNPLYIAGSGSDSLTFYTGSDNGTMIAGDGNDVIRAVGYNVTINAGAGDDTIDTYRNAYYATIKPDSGDDLITFRGNYNLMQYDSGNDTLMNYTENDSIQINGEITNAILDGNNVVFTVDNGTLTMVESNNKTINILDEEGNLSTTVFSGGTSTDTLLNDTVINGTDGDDYLTNYGSNVTINPFEGNDTVVTYGDDGIITTGEGNNLISVVASGNTVIANEGINQIWFSNNASQGRSHNNIAYFGDGTNSIVTADQYSTVIGGANGDGITLHNGSGESYIEGNGGSDTIAIGHDNITVNAGEGDDVINLYRDAEMSIVNAGKGNDTITVYNNVYAQTYKYTSGDGNDVIRGQRGLEMIAGFDDDDTLQIVGVSSVESVISGDDIIFTFDDGGSITLANSAENTINVEYQAQWVTVKGGYKFTSPASFMVDTGSGPKFANFTLSGGNLVDEDNDGKPDSVVIGNVRYIQESGVHTNVNHLTGNVSYNDTLLGVENDDDYGIEAISPIDLSEEWPYNTYITDPNVTAIRGISTNATVSPRGGAGSVTAADWISVDDTSNVVFKDGVYCVYSESYFSSRNYTKLSINNNNQGVNVDTENSNISVIGGLKDGYEITIQSGKNVADEITFKTDGGEGVIVIQSTANSGKYSLSADSDEFINQRFTLSGDEEFKMTFGENGSVTGAEGFDGVSGSWSKVGKNYIYSGVAINDFSQSASFTVSGSSLTDNDNDNAPDGSSVTAFGFNQTVGVMVGLDNVGGEITLNGSSVGVSGDDNYNVHFTAKVIDDASDEIIAYSKIKEVQHISDGATIKTNAGDIVMPDPNAKIYLDSENNTYLNNKYTDKVTISADSNNTLNLSFMHFDSSASVTGDDSFSVEFDSETQTVNINNFDGLIAGSGNINVNDTVATLDDELKPVNIVNAIRKSKMTIDETSTVTDIYGNSHKVNVANNSQVSGNDILVG